MDFWWVSQPRRLISTVGETFSGTATVASESARTPRKWRRECACSTDLWFLFHESSSFSFTPLGSMRSPANGSRLDAVGHLIPLPSHNPKCPWLQLPYQPSVKKLDSLHQQPNAALGTKVHAWLGQSFAADLPTPLIQAETLLNGRP